MTRACGFAAAIWLVASTAHAHPVIDNATERVDEADFEGALEAFAQAEQALDLARADLVTIFARRAAVHLALSNESAAQEDLKRLAALEPNYVFGVWAPPVVRAAFEEVRGDAQRVTLITESDDDGEQLTLRAEVHGDPGGLVRQVFFSTRGAGGRSWTRSTGEVTQLPRGAHEYFAEAVAAGGVVVAYDGRPGSPHLVGEATPDISLLGETGEQADEDDNDSLYWWLGGIAGVAAVAVVVVAVVAATSGSDEGQTVVGAPMVTFR